MSEKVERAVVQGTVTFTVDCDLLIGLVEPEVANNSHLLIMWLQDKAFKMIDSASVEVEVEYNEIVNIAKETADSYTDTIIGAGDWKRIMKENKE